MIAKPHILVLTGRTGKLTAGQKLKYLVKKDDGSFEQKTTDKPVGVTLEATPVVKDRDILLDFRFEHCVAAPPEQIDPQTSLPVGSLIISCRSVNTQLKLKPGEPVIAAAIAKPAAQGLILVRARVLEQPAGGQ